MAKFDPYEMLGVPKDADAKAVNNAFRSKAKAAHPDRGGSAEAFRDLNRAKLILADPKRREQFDRDGATDEEPDNSAAQPLQLIAAMIEQMLATLDDLENERIVDLLRNALRQHKAEAEKLLAKQEREAKAAAKIAARVSGKSGGEVLKPILLRAAEARQAKIAQIKQGIDIRIRALTLIADAGFEPERARGYAYGSTLRSGNSFTQMWPT